MGTVLFNDVCLLKNNKTIIYGQYLNVKPSIKINSSLNFNVVFCKNRNDFYIEINGRVTRIDEITFTYGDNDVVIKDIVIGFPFEKCNLELDADSVIISTMCKDYSSRLEEWIEYNLRLGVSGIVLFDNDENKKNKINEPSGQLTNNGSTSDICKKYNGKVWRVKFNYSPFRKNHWNTIQRITLSIGVNAFREKCGKIALIDADEFIHIPTKGNLIEFLSTYKGKTVTIRSNILTNKSNNDTINNNILDLCQYVGENKYTKTILDTRQISPMEFIVSPHEHRKQIILPKDEIIHYHCWVNSRCKYDEKMKKIECLNC